MSRFGLFTLLMLGFAIPAGAQAAAVTQSRDSLKMVLVHDLLSRMRAVDQAMAAMEATVPAQRAANPRIPSVFWDRFLAQARARRGELEDMIGAVYERHFSSDEIRELLAFYQTPIGQKVLATLPMVMQESMLAGQTWGQRIGASVGAQLEAEGIHIRP